MDPIGEAPIGRPGCHSRQPDRLALAWVGVKPGGAQAAVLVALLCAAAGCASGAAAPSGRPHLSSPRPSSAAGAAGAVSRQLPGCTSATQPGRTLPASATTMTTPARLPAGETAHGPFGVAVTAAGHWGFASIPASDGNGSDLEVLRLEPGHAAKLAHVVPVPGPMAGATLSKNGKLLLVADGTGASVISVPVAERGGKHPVLGMLAAPGGPSADSAIEVAVTPDDRYAFVSLEGAGAIAVFDLATAMTRGFGASGVYVGSVPTPDGPVGLAVSPDGRWLYSTAEQATGPGRLGAVSVISVVRAESDPGASVVAQVPAGCSPVRVITSSDGDVVWVTARGSNALLAFSAVRLRTDSAHALLADVQVGQAPVGLALARGGALLVVADSDRFATGLPPGNLAVVDAADALRGRPSLVGYLSAGRFPRDVAASGDGGLVLVANYGSGQVETVDPAALP